MSDLQDKAIHNEEPRLVDAGQGSFALKTIVYNGKYLYSKYNPSRAVISLIEKSNFLPGSIIIISSPCLWYGLNELKAKAGSECKLIAVEKDDKLYSLANTMDTSIKLYGTKELALLDNDIRTLVATGKYKRALRIDFSAGVALDKHFYEEIEKGLEDIISTFWKNRITLTKLGRLFTKNLFKNLPLLAKSKQLEDVKKTVEKPILVLGAGESLDTTLNCIKDLNRFYIICVDAAFQNLIARNIIPDAIVGVESQQAIQKCYIGKGKREPLLFADLTSRIEIPDILGNNTVFFCSEYSDDVFLSSLIDAGIIHSILPPMGSVGLYALFIALALRESSSIPVLFTGMDFSYSIGVTHAKETSAHRAQLYNATRLNSVENFGASFGNSNIYFYGKDKSYFCTTPVMKAYADSFSFRFRQNENTFDIGKSGIPMGFKTINIDLIQNYNIKENKSNELKSRLQYEEEKLKIKEYLLCKKKELELLRNILIGKKSSVNENQDTALTKLLADNSYLYLHFPDGWAPSLELSFLKRVRAETDIFIKTIDFALGRIL